MFAHILLAENVWLTRLQGVESSKLPIWIDGDLEVCKELVKENETNFPTYFANLTTEELDLEVHYKNSTGTAFNNSI